MKIIYLITKWREHGGAQNHVALLAELIQTAGHEVLVVSGPGGNPGDLPMLDSIRSRVIETIGRDINLVKDSLALLSLIRLLKNEKPDLVSGHSSKAGLLGAIACKVVGVPYVYTAHSWAFLQSSSRLRNTGYLFLWKTFGRLVGHVICVSDFDQRKALEYSILPRHRISTVHNGLLDLEYGPNPVSQLSEHVKGISIGRLAQPKDFPFLVSVIAETKHLYLDIVGEGPQKRRLKDLIEYHGLEDRVRLLGGRQDVPELIEKYDFVVLISNSEGLPLVVLEGMRAMKPVVGSLVGGISEAIVDGETGYLVEIGDNKTLSLYLTELTTNSDLRLKMGNAGRERFLKFFLAEKMLSKTIMIYEATIDKHKKTMLESSSL